jgi:hypothetical protein
MKIDLSYKKCCIIKHALRDKPNKDCVEEIVYKQFSALVSRYNEISALWDDNRTAIIHEPVPYGSRKRILK